MNIHNEKILNPNTALVFKYSEVGCNSLPDLHVDLIFIKLFSNAFGKAKTLPNLTQYKFKLKASTLERKKLLSLH